MAQLRGRHLPVVVALGDPGLSRIARGVEALHLGDARRTEEDAARLRAGIRMGADRLLDHRRRGLAAVAAAGATVVDAPAPKAAAMAVQAYASVKAQGRL